MFRNLINKKKNSRSVKWVEETERHWEVDDDDCPNEYFWICDPNPTKVCVKKVYNIYIYWV